MPAFGRSQLAHWPIDPDVFYLNHGTVGAVPRSVLAAQQRIRDEIERNPSRFLLRELAEIRVGGPRNEAPRLRQAAAVVARFVGVEADDLVFVDNATTGVNSVLRSFELQAGDEILITDLTYGGVANAARHAARECQATVRTIELPWPPTPDRMVEAFAAAVGPRSRLAIVDHITSESALVLPLAEIAAVLRARGVAVLVDGAHAPGALALDLDAYGVDWYTGNLHKWCWTPRSSAILWAPKQRQDGLHPTVISWGLDQGLSEEFDLLGTRDPSMHLAAPAAIEAMQALGLDAIRAWNHALVWEAAQRLTTRWDTPLEAPESMIGCMATLPLPEVFGATRDEAAALRDLLLFEDRIEVQVHPFRGRLWARISAQVYNEIADYERLAEAVLARAGAGRTG